MYWEINQNKNKMKMKIFTEKHQQLKETKNRSERSLRSPKLVDIAFKNIKYSVPSNGDK